MKFSKNLHVVAVVAAMMAFGARAASVSSEQVLNAVSAWAAANGAAFASPGAATSAAPVHGDDGTNVLYWIVTMSNGGAVIASPDTDLDLVVAVLEKYDGAFPAGHPLPSILKRDMGNRLAVLAARAAAAPSNGRPRLSATATAASTSSSASASGDGVSQAIASANAQWAKYGVGGGRPRLKADALEDGDASPYVRRIVDGFETNGRYTHWNQDYVASHYCYNLYTPEHAVCGCVATAGAAILQFFNCTNDVGNVLGKPTYGLEKRDVAYPYNTTKEGALDWSILPKQYGGDVEGTGALNDAGRELLGRAAFNMGVLVDMAWDEGGPHTESGALLSKLVDAFKAYGFKTSRHVVYSADEKTDGKEFFKTIYAQVWCGAPVALGIRGDPGGHAVIGCGYARDPDGDEFCRVFMGWSGSGDAWYKFPKIQDFKVVENAVTMIGLYDDAVVPVYGEANIPGVDLTLPGYLIDGQPATVEVNENGFFGIRVPVSLTDRTIVYTPRGKSADITPFDAATLASISNDLETLDAAIPDEIFFSILNATVKSTPTSGRFMAMQEDKALLLVSGSPGTPRTKTLMEYIYYLDDTTDFSNKFVLVFNNYRSSDPNRPDGNPSIGVFDPDPFVPGERWVETNGRLTYEPFIDYEATYASTNGPVYTYTAGDAGSMTNDVDEVLDVGYDGYLRLHGNIVVKVTGADAGVDLANPPDDPNAPFEVTASVAPGYGLYENVLTNGECVVFTAEGTYTNEEKGVIYSCVGWTTNALYRFEEGLFGYGGEWVQNPYNKGTRAELQFFSDTTNTLTWVWKVTHYRVTGVALLPYSTEEQPGAVTPSEIWAEDGERVTLVSAAKIKSWGFSDWSLQLESDPSTYYDDFYNSDLGQPDAAAIQNGLSVSFNVYAPVKFTAKYRSGVTPATSTTFSMAIASDPADLATAGAPVPLMLMLVQDSENSTLRSDLAWGDNTLDNSIVSFMPLVGQTYTDATGGVWKCTGVYVNRSNVRSVDGGYVVKDLSQPVAVTCAWERQESDPDPDPPTPPDPPDPPEPPTPEPPTPAPIAISSIVKAGEGEWTITVTNSVKDCWYWLYATSDLSEIAGDSSAAWKAEKATTTEANPQQATADDGEIVFHATATGANMFWRAKVTATEDGD